MGIRILAGVIATLAAFHVEAVTLPALPPLKLADLRLQLPSSGTPLFLPSSFDTLLQDNRQSINNARWLKERQTFAQERRWVF